MLSKRTTRRTTPWAKLLSPRGGNLIQIDRKINVGDEFLIYNRFFLAADKYAFFPAKVQQRTQFGEL
jgi:hypothetical protein